MGSPEGMALRGGWHPSGSCVCRDPTAAETAAGLGGLLVGEARKGGQARGGGCGGLAKQERGARLVLDLG